MPTKKKRVGFIQREDVMINIDLLRSKDSKTIESLINRNVDKSELDKITEFDTKRRKLIEKMLLF